MPALLERELLVISPGVLDRDIGDEEGAALGTVRTEGPGVQAVYDADGRRVVSLRRVRALLRARIQVADGDGEPLGRIVPRGVLGPTRFALEDAGGRVLGEARAGPKRTWSFFDASGAEVGRVTRTWGGLRHELLAGDDNDVVEVRPGAPAVLRRLLLAAATAIAD